MANSVTKADLIAQVATETGLRRADASKAITALTDAIFAALTSGNRVTLVGFGTFTVAERKARKGRNPQTRTQMEIAASRHVKFKPGKGMKEAVNS